MYRNFIKHKDIFILLDGYLQLTYNIKYKKLYHFCDYGVIQRECLTIEKPVILGFASKKRLLED